MSFLDYFPKSRDWTGPDLTAASILFDQKNIPQAAGDLEQIFRSKAKKGEPVREDLMNLLQIVKDKGLAGLRKAVKAKEFLPSLAAIGLAPTIYRMSQPADQQSDG
jgi:hypothetical protein